MRTRLIGPEQDVWLNRATAELGNLRSALQFSLDDPYLGKAGLRLFGNLHQLWFFRTNFSEIRTLADRLLDSPGAQESTLARMRVLRLAGVIAGYQHDHAASVEYCSKGLNIARDLKDAKFIGQMLIYLGNAHIYGGDNASCLAYFEEARDCYEQVDDPDGLASVYSTLSYIKTPENDYSIATDYSKKCVAILRSIKGLSSFAPNLRYLGEVHCRLNEGLQPRDCFLESLSLFQKLNDVRGLASVIASVATNVRVTEKTARLFGATDELNARMGAASPFFDNELKHASDSLGAKNFATQDTEGRRFSQSQAVEELRSLLSQPLDIKNATSKAEGTRLF